VNARGGGASYSWELGSALIWPVIDRTKHTRMAWIDGYLRLIVVDVCIRLPVFALYRERPRRQCQAGCNLCIARHWVLDGDGMFGVSKREIDSLFSRVAVECRCLSGTPPLPFTRASR
jgi:hypothetical protein